MAPVGALPASDSRSGHGPGRRERLVRARPVPRHRRGQAAAPDLNNLIVNGFGWLYQRTQNTVYWDGAEQIFAGGVAGAWLSGSKQFNENSTTSLQYLAYSR
jgi:hypothetical protein